MSKSKPQLHQVLAVEGDLQGKAQSIIQETIKTFTGKRELFMGYSKTYEPYQEDATPIPPDFREIETTVHDKLKYAIIPLIKYLDCICQKESTNQHAFAPLVVDGKTFHECVPATLLLALENKLRAFRPVLEAIPTLTKGVAWEKGCLCTVDM